MTDEDDCRCDCDHCEMSRELKVFKKMIASLNFRIVIIENERDLQTQKTKEEGDRERSLLIDTTPDFTFEILKRLHEHSTRIKELESSLQSLKDEHEKERDFYQPLHNREDVQSLIAKIRELELALYSLQAKVTNLPPGGSWPHNGEGTWNWPQKK